MSKHTTASSLNKNVLHRISILPAIVLLLGLYLSINAELTQRSEDNQKIELAVESAVVEFESQITERLYSISHGLRGVDSLIAAVGKENFDYTVMQSFARSRNFQTEFPGVRGFGFIQNVAPENLDSFIAAARAMRPDGKFNVRHLSSELQHLFIIRDILPESANASAIGLNIGSEENRRNAAISSLSRKDITITDPITLVQADDSIKQGFLILLPFIHDTESTNRVQTLENTWGWSYAPIIISEVVESVGRTESDLIFSISHLMPSGNLLFYQSAEIQQNKDVYSHHHSSTVFGKIWQFEAITTPAFNNAIKQKPYAAFSQYIILTFLAAITLFSIHLFISKRFESKAHIAELAVAKEQTLQDDKKKLEAIVERRTQEIQKSARFQNAILKSSPYSIIATDENGLITTFNPAAEKLLGYKAGDMIGKESVGKFHLEEEVIARAKTLSEETGTKIKPGFDVFTHKILEHGQDEGRWTYVHHDGTYIKVRLSVTGLLDDHKQIIGYLGIAYDLTEQLAYEKIIKNEKEKAEQATLAKSQFLANMSHEIRTPLNGVQGALQILQGKALSDDVSSLIKIASSSMRTLILLVDDILDISKVEAGKIHIETSPFQLDELLNSLFEEFRNRAESKGIQLILENHCKHKTWSGDELRIKQILTNLLSNAVKFTEQGSVSISVDCDKNKELQFTVIDTGIGMEDATLSVLYNRFEQADKSITRKFGGSGLGMAISKSLIDLMHGRIEVTSKINVGTTFVLHLPLKPLSSAPLTNIEAVTSKIDLSDFSILVAEDNEINQIILQTMLSDLGAKVVIVDDGQKAVDIVTEQSFKLALLDIQMPVLDGVQACVKIKEMLPNLPVIALTANVFDEDIEIYKQAGFDSYMGKPFERDKLISLIHSYLG